VIDQEGANNKMEFSDVIKRALIVRKRYVISEQERYGTPWTNEEIALGFVGDVGDLAKLVMAENGRRNIPQMHDKLAHELADCLWSIIVLSDVHKIDLEKAFLQTMNEIESDLQQ
jgi:NTP pyrophosphatase (non-canonical NTP hydrolase)